MGTGSEHDGMRETRNESGRVGLIGSNSYVGDFKELGCFVNMFIEHVRGADDEDTILVGIL